MPAINLGGHFLLTEAVIKNRLAKSIFEGGHYKRSASKYGILEAVIYKKSASVKRAKPRKAQLGLIDGSRYIYCT